MLIIPAIDILGGQCVRLQEGDYSLVRQYDDDPAAVARRFFDDGATRIHVVDLDAAKSGDPANFAVIRRLLAVAKEYNGEVQVGGGIRSDADAERMLDAGASFVVVGTAAVLDPEMRRRLTAAYPGRVIVGMDVRDGHVYVAGWRQDGGISEAAFLRQLREHPPAGIVYTDIRRDGMLSGVNARATAETAAHAPCPVIASGGVNSCDDIRAVADCGNIAGVIIGQAIYSGTITLADALACVSE